MDRMRVLLSEIDLLAAVSPSDVSVGEVVYPARGRYGPRWQRNLQLLVVYTGSARVWVDDRAAATVPAACVGLLLPGHLERFAFDDETATHHAWVEFPVDAPPAALERFAQLPAVLPTSHALVMLVAEGIKVARTPLSTREPLLAALSVAAIWQYVGEAESRVDRHTEPVERAQRFMHEHLTDPSVDLGQIAAAAHVSAPHLIRRFRAELGVTPMAYVWRERVARGIDLLRSTGLSVGEVAARSGFVSVYHFSRRIKAHTGLPPTEIRARWIASGSDAEPDPSG